MISSCKQAEHVHQKGRASGESSRLIIDKLNDLGQGDPLAVFVDGPVGRLAFV